MPNSRPTTVALDLRSEAGVSLMAVMIAVGVIGAMVSGASMMMRHRTDARLVRSALLGKEFAYQYIKNQAASPDSLAVTMNSNAMLRQCVMGGGCNNTKEASAKLMALRVPLSNKSGSRSVVVSSASSGGTAGHFNWRGLPNGCAKGAADCHYWASVEWWAECAIVPPAKVPPNNCNAAQKIYVRPHINIMHASESNATNHAVNMMKQSNFPTAKMLAEHGKDYMFAVNTSDIKGAAIEQCPQGAYSAGVSDTGNIKCHCDQGYKDTHQDDPITGWPTCVVISKCPIGSILAGSDKDGNEVCKKPPGDDYTCETFSTPSNGVVNCKPGYRMRQVATTDECYIKNIPKEGDVVDCAAMQITCCIKN